MGVDMAQLLKPCLLYLFPQTSIFIHTLVPQPLGAAGVHMSLRVRV